MGSFGIMTQIKSYGVPFTHGAGNILPTHSHELPLEKTVPKPVGNIFPSHTQVIPAFQQTIGNFFNKATKSRTFANVRDSVSFVTMTSTSSINSAGEKKCTPIRKLQMSTQIKRNQGKNIDRKR